MENYDVVAVAVTPAASGAPSFTELNPIAADGLSWTKTLNREGGMTASVKPEQIPENIAERLRDLKTYPTELRVYRGSTLVQAGPIVGFVISGDDTTLSLNAGGILYYARYMTLEADYTPDGVDQYTIGKTLVDQYQALSYGHYGIDTSGIGASGTTRKRVYLARENHFVYQRLLELAEVEGGFDLAIDPTTRALSFAASMGTDRTSTVVLDRRNISNPAIAVSVAAGDVATDVRGSSTDAEGTVLTSSDAHTADRVTGGRKSAVAHFDGVSEQTTLDEKTAAFLDARSTALLRPAGNAIPLEDMDVLSFDVGDTIGYAFDSGIGVISGSYRVFRKSISVDSDGTETMTVEFL